MADDKTEKQAYGRVELSNLAQGAVNERFTEELRKLMANIDDLNYEARSKRSITIEVIFAPDASRQAVEFWVKFKTKLAAPKTCEGIVFMAHERDGQAFAVADNWRQPELLKN